MTLGSSTHVLGFPTNIGHSTTPSYLITKRPAPIRSSIWRPALHAGRRSLRRVTAALPYTVTADSSHGSGNPSVTGTATGTHSGSESPDPNLVSRKFPSHPIAAAGSSDAAGLSASGSVFRSTGNGGSNHGDGAATIQMRPTDQVPDRLPPSAVPEMLLLPVAVCKTITLSPQATLADGVLALLRRLPSAVAAHAALPSGVLRLEVTVPRTATTALRWLSGQQQQWPQQVSDSSPADGGPFLYFSGRRSSAPDTPGAVAAEAATRGWSSLAGAGAAWRWWGPGGGGFDSQVVSALQRFLSPDQPRIRILGGVRFDPRRIPGPEWASFGSHCFVLPLLELTEAADCCLLAVTLAWDPDAAKEAGAAAATSASGATGTSDGAFCGCADLATAAARAEAALRLMQPPAPASAYGLRVSRSEPQHSPSKEEWDAHMEALLGGLQEGQDTGVPAAAALASLLDTGLARQEYLTHGQQGLDDLLAALTLSASTATANAARQSADSDSGDGLDALRDLIDGKVTVSELTAATTTTAAAATAAVGSAATTPGGGSILSADGEAAEELSKVVMARRTTMRIEGLLDPLHVLQSLQERDPRAYQLYFAPGTGFGGAAAAALGGDPATNVGPGLGPAFLACTPERLYARTGRFVASEAVAGTRPRGRGGDVEQDFWLSLDLLRSAKDHAEFCSVRDWIASQLAGPCEDVHVEIRKSVLKQGSVQHLFGRVAAALRRGRNDAHLLAALHPTPAVCGRPREAALGYLDELESFDRGWYAGPFGWISGAGAEFVVAIRSGLVCPELPPSSSPASETNSLTGGISNGTMNGRTMADKPSHVSGSEAASVPVPPQWLDPRSQKSPRHQRAPFPPASLVHMFAGVGVVRGSDPVAEWQELDLKIRPLSSALMAAPLPSAAPNINVAWAGLLVEELCRLGVDMFCVAPGSRSSPLTHAIARHPRARLNVCIDERSLGFWALGYGRASGRPAAVVTSSGTAVANLLPAVVEASLSGVPLLLLTADRPAELRDTAANQTIDQTKIFGGFVRWFFDVPPPGVDIPGRTVLTTASTAYRAAVASCPPGPVHLNLQFREPLAPVTAPWSPAPFLAGLSQWQASRLPYTSHISGAVLPGAAPGGGGSESGISAGFGAGPDVYGVGSGSGGADVAALRALLRGAQRGLVVVGELTDPRDIVAARQIGSVLGWPVVADVLSGLRVGVVTQPTSQPSLGTAGGNDSNDDSTPSYTNAVPLVHHMDHILLGDRAWWEQLRPDVILQLGPHLTSKRVGQFTDWAAMGVDGGNPGAPWVYVAAHTLRHDPSHLVTHRAVMTMPEFRDAVVEPAVAAAAARGPRQFGGHRIGFGAAADPWVHVSSYGRLLLQLDEAVAHEVDTALSSLESISEPFIARALARSLPGGHGLFIGNSMPIRDMDMYASPPLPSPSSVPSAAVQQQQTAVTASAVVGVPVAANRGASGIDGVLSTAAGFAEGLSRPATLLVGDLSFLHDINGLNLLRAGELRPPLTVVLINNAGGGIFSFLPIASSVPEDEFTPLWATPQNVDLEAMCRAQGIPHQKVSTPGDLLPALQAAWGLNRHSVVEVTTDRSTNVELHRRIQAAALRAAQHCYRLTSKLGAAVSSFSSSLSLAPVPDPAGQLAEAGSGCSPLVTNGVHWRRYSLPLVRPLTTAPTSISNSNNHSSSGSGPSTAVGVRDGLLLQLRLSWADGSVAGEGVGDVAPLPGLHSETLEEAEVQVAALSEILDGVAVPPSLALLGGRIDAWMGARVGLDPAWLLPSVRFGLESALLSALAAALKMTLADLIAPLRPPPPPPPPPSSSSMSASSSPQSLALRDAVLLNGLLSPPVSSDCAMDAAAAATEALRLVAEGYTAIKVKVARRPDPEGDAAVLAAIRAAVGPHVVLRADANRGWTELQTAVAFGRAVAAAAVGLQYVEEPTRDPRDMAAFYMQTGVPVAADESLDEGLLMAPPDSANVNNGTRSRGRGGGGSGGGGGGTAAVGAGASMGSYSAAGLPLDRAAGLAAVVVKPSVLGGLEAAMDTARWAQRRGVQVVISSAFESSVGVAALVQLAAAVDDSARGGGGGGGGPAVAHHGLGTLQWFAADVTPEPLQWAPRLLPPHAQVPPLPQPSSLPAPTASSDTGPSVTMTSSLQPGGGEFLPLQAICGTVEQADRLLRACAAGREIRREILLASEAEAEAVSRNAVSFQSRERTRAGTSVAGGAATGSNAAAHRISMPSYGVIDPSVSGELEDDRVINVVSTSNDPWVGPYAHGGVLERPFFVEVEYFPSSSLTTPRPAGFVQMGGLEVLPPMHHSTAPSHSSTTSTLPCGGANNGRQRHFQQEQRQQQRRPFMFLHGFLGSSSDWRPLMRALAAAGHRCVAIDLPGHGSTLPSLPASHRSSSAGSGIFAPSDPTDSSHVGELSVHSIPGAAACVAAAARRLGLEGAVVVGYSLGARAAAARMRLPQVVVVAAVAAAARSPFS
ncbi:hypothetical protein Vafri_6487 [Volvox africanus]|uniref:Mandelate racemase/muconate lactonizing enzyme C-terminal domain-containing protein n=1 Tax=Volvox africanus TaxID=51714 RepID=A0A8J4AY83_9CHLO|nr:hypothetical protein Vafri_6487 [Volvox africanus]